MSQARDRLAQLASILERQRPHQKLLLYEDGIEVRFLVRSFA